MVMDPAIESHYGIGHERSRLFRRGIRPWSSSDRWSCWSGCCSGRSRAAAGCRRRPWHLCRTAAGRARLPRAPGRSGAAARGAGTPGSRPRSRLRLHRRARLVPRGTSGLAPPGSVTAAGGYRWLVIRTLSWRGSCGLPQRRAPGRDGGIPGHPTSHRRPNRSPNHTVRESFGFRSNLQVTGYTRWVSDGLNPRHPGPQRSVRADGSQLLEKSLQLMTVGMATITAPGRVSPRHVTTPILLPESDMACWLAIIAIIDGGVAAAGISVRCRRLPGTA